MFDGILYNKCYKFEDKSTSGFAYIRAGDEKFIHISPDVCIRISERRSSTPCSGGKGKEINIEFSIDLIEYDPKTKRFSILDPSTRVDPNGVEYVTGVQKFKDDD